MPRKKTVARDSGRTEKRGKYSKDFAPTFAMNDKADGCFFLSFRLYTYVIGRGEVEDGRWSVRRRRDVVTKMMMTNKKE